MPEFPKRIKAGDLLACQDIELSAFTPTDGHIYDFT